MNRKVQYKDLREFLSIVDSMGELKTISRVHWDKEMGAITEIVYREKPIDSPALLFDKIPGYPDTYRCLYGMLASARRFGLAIGAGTGDLSRMDLLMAYRERMKDMEPIPPRFVTSGPVMENVLEGNEVDLLKFPVPIHHELDGGRYIGTACGVITKDPDEGWVNVGTYRVQVLDNNKFFPFQEPVRHHRNY